MNGLEMSSEMIRAREAALFNPDRKHEADGIGSVPISGCAEPNLGIPDSNPVKVSGSAEIPVSQRETYTLALDFLADLASPEGYGHAVSPEVVKRAARILATLRPKPSGIGYTEPPPARCQRCDEE
jgi:hypothetical protein